MTEIHRADCQVGNSGNSSCCVLSPKTGAAAEVLCCNAAAESFFEKFQSLLSRPSADWVRPMDVMEGNMPHLSPVTVNVNHV